MKKQIFFLLFLHISFYTIAQPPAYSLGNGLLILKSDLNGVLPTRLYKDSSCKQQLVYLTKEQTTCPTCFVCAEPVDNYKGTIHPFICGGNNGINFICTGQSQNAYEIITDTLGTRAWVKKTDGKYYNWNTYMQWRASLGDFFRFDNEDNLVLYDKTYPLTDLPKPKLGTFQVNLSLNNIDNLRFYPVEVQGYWMKLKAKEGNKTQGYCWIIWRNETDWLTGFAWNP